MLIASNKTSCAEWFIHTFHVTLNEVVAMAQKRRMGRRINVSMWRMLLHVFPGMTGTTAITYFKTFVCASPLHIQVSINKLGLTLSNINPNEAHMWPNTSLEL
ncbi:hypothetical protein Pelo_9547 [Pelomyxa schiedti]|nr:hypothetical protein Pelo_9547 [Pelomyxa schiedti]